MPIKRTSHLDNVNAPSLAAIYQWIVAEEERMNDRYKRLERATRGQPENPVRRSAEQTRWARSGVRTLRMLIEREMAKRGRREERKGHAAS